MVDHGFHRISMRSLIPEVAIPQITADHLPKYNLGFFFRSRRNNNRIWHFTSSELRMNKNKKINVTSVKFSVSVLFTSEFTSRRNSGEEIFMRDIFEK
jgi:CTP synthase (UTP-ammonia lyase)